MYLKAAEQCHRYVDQHQGICRHASPHYPLSVRLRFPRLGRYAVSTDTPHRHHLPDLGSQSQVQRSFSLFLWQRIDDHRHHLQERLYVSLFGLIGEE